MSAVQCLQPRYLHSMFRPRRAMQCCEDVGVKRTGIRTSSQRRSLGQPRAGIGLGAGQGTGGSDVAMCELRLSTGVDVLRKSATSGAMLCWFCKLFADTTTADAETPTVEPKEPLLRSFTVLRVLCWRRSGNPVRLCFRV